MSDFKRNSSRFSRDGGNSSGSRGPTPRPNTDRGPAPSSNGGAKSYPFTRIASMTVPKSAPDDVREFIFSELKGSIINLMAKVYLGKGDNELVLKNGDELLVTFKVSDKDKEFVVGHVQVKN